MFVSSSTSSSVAPKKSRARARWFALAILLLSLLLHLFILGGVNGELDMLSFEASPEQIVQVSLHSATPDQPAASAIVQTKKPAATAIVPAPVPVPAPAPAPVSEALPPTASESEPASQAIADSSHSVPPEAAAEPAKNMAVETATPVETEVAAAPLFSQVSMPQSVALRYDVTASKDGRKIEGHGSINWQSDGQQYSIAGEAGVLFFTVLNYKSSGRINSSGLAPDLYVEKRFRKSETNTHFQREKNSISFSASTESYPIKGSEQDRASVIWQIAALGKGNSAVFAPGLAFEIFIAGTRAGAMWRVYVNQLETISLDGRPTEAWHLSLMPAEPSFDMQFELWLAPQKDWVPVKLHYADRNDGYLEMLLTKMEKH